MVPDPYKALGLGHNASKNEIKKAYRKLAMQLHPDRLTRNNASEEEQKVATSKFAEISSAYALLSDDVRKHQYDHIYKFGGYDELVNQPPTSFSGASSTTDPQFRNGVSANAPQRSSSFTRPTKSPMGIGYAVSDPVAYLLSQGKVRSTTVAGVQIPSRFNMTQTANGGFRVSFSHGQLRESPSGTLEHVSRTTQFVRGKKFSRVETTTLHKDGRKEVLIEGDDYIERRFSTTAPKRRRRSQQRDQDDLTHSNGDDLPWYMSAWNGLRDNLQMCYNPCGTISVR